MSKYTQNTLIISILFVIFSFLFLFIFFNRTSRDSLVEQVQHRQQLAVRTGAKSIENLLNSMGRSLVILANDPSTQNMDEYIRIWSDTNIAGLSVSDINGDIIKLVNSQNIKEKGINVKDRDYFQWALSAKHGEYKVFSPVLSRGGASRGKYIIPISTSIYKDGKPYQVIMLSVLLPEISKNYIEDIKILETSKVYIITEDGEIVYSLDDEMLNKKLSEVFSQDFLGKEKVVEILELNLKKQGETKIKIALPDMSTYKLNPYLITASPIVVSDQMWKIVAVTLEKDLNVFTYKLSNYQILISFILVTSFVLIILRLSKAMGYQEAVVDEHKLHKINS